MLLLSRFQFSTFYLAVAVDYQTKSMIFDSSIEFYLSASASFKWNKTGSKTNGSQVNLLAWLETTVYSTTEQISLDDPLE